MFAQKRLACSSCRSKKLRCNTLYGDDCQQCIRRGLCCTRPSDKRLLSVDSSEPTSSPDPSLSSQNDLMTKTVADVQHVKPFQPSAQLGHLGLGFAEKLFADALVMDGDQRLDYSNQMPNPDHAIALDPILCGIMSLKQAEDLFLRFNQTFGRNLAYFDERLYTFAYVRAASHALLTAICLISARVEPNFESVRNRLEVHFHNVVWPAILLQSFCSVAIVQAIMLLAAFEPPSKSVREDKSWSFLSHAVRIASEINMQASLKSRTEGDETSILTERNSQRAWINLWLHEFSLAQHTGRSAIVSEQELWPLCTGWHKGPLACHSDFALESMVELRTLVKHNAQLMVRLGMGNEVFCVRSCKHDLRAWQSKWFSHDLPRLELAELYVSHAIVQFISSIFSKVKQDCWYTDLILELYEACLTYLGAFPMLLPPEKLKYCYNSMFVAATFETLVALRLTEMATDYTFIDVDDTRSRCNHVVQTINHSSLTNPQHSTASCYSKFLNTILRQSGENQSDAAHIQPQTSLTPSAFASFDLDFDDFELFAWAGPASMQKTNNK